MFDSSCLAGKVDSLSVGNEGKRIDDEESLRRSFSEEIAGAKERVIIVSDTLNPVLFGNRELISLFRDKADANVQFSLLSGTFIKTKENIKQAKPTHEFLETFISDKKHFSLNVRFGRPPILHYLLVDDAVVIVEVVHKLGEESRTYFRFEDSDLASVFWHRFEFCVNDLSAHRVSSIKEYSFKNKFPKKYVSEQHKYLLEKADLDLAETRPDLWIKKILHYELNLYHKRLPFSDWDVGRMHDANISFWEKNLDILKEKHSNKWVLVVGGEVCLTADSLSGVMERARDYEVPKLVKFVG
ncbi:MAG: hypothetical protein HQL64_02310 [Magnetococcales bacterium]|nr:hypothetical protein [Magnetococcales bacterium]